jgi:GxxExxY protein
MLIYEELSGQIRGAAIEVHRELGPGLLESAYEECLCYELRSRGIAYDRQLELPVKYKGLQLDCGYRIDVLVEKKIVLELKSVESLLAIHEAQLMTYLKLSGCKLGMLMNFNVVLMKEGMKRIVL